VSTKDIQENLFCLHERSIVIEEETLLENLGGIKNQHLRCLDCNDEFWDSPDIWLEEKREH
jgi:hypothetical protein